MSRKNKWWETEQPLTTQAGNFLIEHFAQAGVVQFFNIVPNSTFGKSKGVVLHLDRLDPEQLKQLSESLGTIARIEAGARLSAASKQEPAPLPVVASAASNPATAAPVEAPKPPQPVAKPKRKARAG